jgi:hypothetical protein
LQALWAAASSDISINITVAGTETAADISIEKSDQLLHLVL